MSKKESATPGNPDDLVRDAILRHLYEVHKAARGAKSVAIGIRELQKAMREKHGHKQNQVASNLDYLLQKGWVAEVVESRSFTTPRGTTQSSEKHSYKISDVGIDRLEKASAYQHPPTTTGINIYNVHGVTVIGDGNVVNTDFTDLVRLLTDMRASIQSSQTVSDDQKLDIIADIDSLQAQLQKPEPNRSVIGLLWSAIETAVVAAGFVELVDNVRAFIQPLLT